MIVECGCIRDKEWKELDSCATMHCDHVRRSQTETILLIIVDSRGFHMQYGQAEVIVDACGKEWTALDSPRKTSASTHLSSSRQRASFNLKVPSFSSSKAGKGIKNKYEYIPDNYSSLEQVTKALRESGLESSNLILGIDFTKSNEWTGMSP
ncbi:hypothetical protein Tco_0039523 [Tanacetum coccineum]